MKLKYIGAVFLTTAVIVSASTARADVSIAVTPASAPNAFGSANWTPWVNNAIYALENGLTTYGAPGPAQYNVAPSSLSVSNNVVTGFASWNGVAAPTGAYANEYGNRLQFGLDIKGNGTLISIDQLSFSATSTDPGNTLGFGFGAGSYSYSSSYVGWDYGADHVRGTLDDIFVTSGPASQLVDEIVGRGSGNAWDTYESDPGPTDQDRINNVPGLFDLPSTPFDFTGTYALGSATGSATVTFQPVPEPSTFALAGLGILGLVARFRKR